MCPCTLSSYFPSTFSSLLYHYHTFSHICLLLLFFFYMWTLMFLPDTLMHSVQTHTSSGNIPCTKPNLVRTKCWQNGQAVTKTRDQLISRLKFRASYVDRGRLPLHCITIHWHAKSSGRTAYPTQPSFNAPRQTVWKQLYYSAKSAGMGMSSRCLKTISQDRPYLAKNNGLGAIFKSPE